MCMRETVYTPTLGEEGVAYAVQICKKIRKDFLFHFKTLFNVTGFN